MLITNESPARDIPTGAGSAESSGSGCLAAGGSRSRSDCPSCQVRTASPSSGVVGGWGGGAGAAGREGPADHSRLGLLDLPVGCLLAAVMRPAFRAEVAFVGWPVGVG